jgi:SiaC family regulatory phosphoprotein
MKTVILKENVSIPKVEYDDRRKILSIYGRAFPELACSFSEPIKDWIEENNPQIDKISITLEYINTSCSKVLMGLLNNLKCKEIDWFYEKGDDDMESFGEMIRDGLNLNVKISSVKEIKSATFSSIEKRDKEKYLEFIKKISNFRK